MQTFNLCIEDSKEALILKTRWDTKVHWLGFYLSVNLTSRLRAASRDLGVLLPLFACMYMNYGFSFQFVNLM